jgi:hypothetical protein
MRLTGRDFAGLLRCIALAMEVIDAEAEEAARQAAQAQQAQQATAEQAERERLAAEERARMPQDTDRTD